MKLSARQLKAWEKFSEDLNSFRAETGEDFAILYEDAFTTREVKDFKMTETGVLTWRECETFKESERQEKRADDQRRRCKGMVEVLESSFAQGKKVLVNGLGSP